VIIFLPRIVRFDQTEYEDGLTLTHEDFYKKLSESDNLPTTSQLAPAAFAKVFEEVSAANDTAVVITVSAKLSGTYQSAMIAASEYQNIFVVDSANVCIGERILVERALALREEQLSAEQIAEKLGQELYLDFEAAQSWYMAKLVNAYYLFGLGLRQEIISALQPKVS